MNTKKAALMRHTKNLVLLCLLLCAAGGCGAGKKVVEEKRPRPVVATVLKKSPPPEASLIAASAGAWKTEQIGFEVAGRVEYVVDQNTSIEGRIYDSQGKPLIEGTPIAQLENERFRLQVARATADIRRAEQNLVAAETELSESIPAQIASAAASRSLAETLYSRSTRLRAQNATSQEEVDQHRANRDSANARVKELEALAKSKQAEIESLKAAVLQAEQNLRDAERNLEDCTLYSSFRGQVANVSVVPGSVVSAGTPVVTLQMMDPIKIELEVSAQQSRKLRRTDRHPVYVTTPDGKVEVHSGYLHQIDPGVAKN